MSVWACTAVAALLVRGEGGSWRRVGELWPFHHQNTALLWRSTHQRWDMDRERARKRLNDCGDGGRCAAEFMDGRRRRRFFRSAAEHLAGSNGEGKDGQKTACSCQKTACSC